MQLDALPQGVGLETGGAVLALDSLDRLQHAPVVVIDAVAAHLADGAPVAGLEVLLRGACAIPEEGVVAVESVAHRNGDRAGGVVGGGGVGVHLCGGGPDLA